MKKLLISFLLLSAAAPVLRAESPVKDFCLNVNDFTELKVVNNVNVEYYASADSAGMVCFCCDKDLAEHFMFSNKNNSLLVQIDYDNMPAVYTMPTLRVYSTTLQKVENSGDSLVTVKRLPPINTFSAKLIGNGYLTVNDIKADNINASINTGSGTLTISGSTISAKLSNVGTGPLEANGLACRTAKCILVGTGPIDVNVSEQLSVFGAGSGTVYYSGNPKKIVNRTIGVKAKAVQ